MRPRINPWVFLARLLVFFALTYLCWQPIAPLYAQFLLRAAQVGVWLSEFSTDPLWQHPTELLIVPARSPAAIWRVRFLKLGLAVLVALVLQVIDVVVGIKAFYSSSFRGMWSPFATKL